jgi:hypothetical protein
LLVLCLGLTIGFPVYQLIVNSGYVYFTNGPDETTYLLYEFSKAAQSLTRSGQALVTLGHEAGLSGGWINLIMDTTLMVLFPVLMRAILRRSGWTPAQATIGAVLALVLPQIVLLNNPILAWLEDWRIRTGALFWFNMPSIGTSLYWRTPEPQFSYLLLGVGVLAGLRWRTMWPVYAVLPFIYPFVAIPVGFVAIACHLRTWWPASLSRHATWGPLAGAFTTLGLGCWAYYTVAVSPSTKLFVVASHLPLFSLTSTVAIVVYMLMRTSLSEPYRFAALALALAPLAACNQQIISGHVPQPDNFESYAGTLAVALVVAFGVQHRPRLRTGLLVIGLVAFGAASLDNARMNLAFQRSMPMTPALVTALREDAGLVVINQMELSSYMDLVHPRQQPTALSFGKTFPLTADRHIAQYRCIKKQVLIEHPTNRFFIDTFDYLDNFYRYGSQTYNKAHIGRKASHRVLQDTSADACQSTKRLPLRYFLVN